MLRWLLLLFPILVLAGDANLTWTAPTTNTDGSQLEDLSGYRIYRNQDADPIASTIEPYYLDNGLSTGDYDWHVTAVNSEGVESDPSNVASKSIFDDTGLPGKPIVYLAQGPPDTPMTAATVYIDFDNTDGGRDGSAEDPYNSFAEFQTARAETLDQAMHVYVTGDGTGTFWLNSSSWGTSSSNRLTFDGQGIATLTATANTQTLFGIATAYVTVTGFSIYADTYDSVRGINSGTTGNTDAIIHGNYIDVSGGGSNNVPLDIRDTDWLVYNNVFVGGNSAIQLLDGAEPFRIYNNTCIDTEYRGISITANGDGYISNNIVQNATGSDFYFSGTGSHTTSANITSDATSPDGADWRSIDLDFTAPGSGDYSLARSDYQAKYTGDDSVSSYFTDDIEGTTRVNYSVGAYEYEQEATAYVDFDEASNGDGSSGSPYNTFANFEIGEAATLAQAMHVYVDGTSTNDFYLDDAAWSTSSSNILTLDGQGIATLEAWGSTASPLAIGIEYVTITGFIFDLVTYSSVRAVKTYPTGTANGTIHGNYIDGSNTGSSVNCINISGPDWLIYNNVIIGGDRAIRIDTDPGVFRVYNNTAIDQALYGISIVDADDDAYISNNIVQNAGSGDWWLAGAGSHTTSANISSDATSPDVSFRSITLTFAGVDDYHLDSTDTEATDTGEVLSAYFTDDLEGTTRSNWSVGAYEFVSGGDVEVTLSPGAAIGTTVAPTVVLGSQSISLSNTTAVGTTILPTVVLGSQNISLDLTTGIGTTVSPTVVLGSQSISLDPTAAIGTTVSPTVVLGSQSISLDLSEAVGTTVAPTVVLGSQSLPLDLTEAVGTTVAPTVVLGSQNISLDLSTAVGTTVDFTVTAGGDVDVPLSNTVAVGTTVAPTVVLGSQSISLSNTTAVGSTVAPTVVLGSQSVSISNAVAVGTTVIPTVVLGSQSISLSLSTGIGTTVSPTVVLGSQSISLDLSTAVGATVAFSVTEGGDIEVPLSNVAAVGATVVPTVVLGSQSVSLALSTAVGTTVSPSVNTDSPDVPSMRNPTWPTSYSLCRSLARTLLERGLGSALDPVEDPVISPLIDPTHDVIVTTTGISLACPTVGASIYYTTDGTIPSASKTLWNGTPFNLSLGLDQEVKAIGILAGRNDSSIMTHEYDVVAGSAPTSLTYEILV